MHVRPTPILERRHLQIKSGSGFRATDGQALGYHIAVTVSDFALTEERNETKYCIATCSACHVENIHATDPALTATPAQFLSFLCLFEIAASAPWVCGIAQCSPLVSYFPFFANRSFSEKQSTPGGLCQDRWRAPTTSILTGT